MTSQLNYLLFSFFLVLFAITLQQVNRRAVSATNWYSRLHVEEYRAFWPRRATINGSNGSFANHSFTEIKVESLLVRPQKWMIDRLIKAPCHDRCGHKKNGFGSQFSPASMTLILVKHFSIGGNAQIYRHRFTSAEFGCYF